MKNNLIYNSKNIKILKGLEAVKKRPGMYIGDTDNGQGLHQMIFEIIDNSIDEVLSGYCKNIKVYLYKDGSISIKDDGRGIPIDLHEEGKYAAEIIMTILHSGAKFDSKIYNVSGGLHGVGISVVNALSKKLFLQIFRKDKIYFQLYKYGIPNSPKIFNRNKINKNNYHGTLIRFWPNKKIFTNILNFNSNIIKKRIKELAFLNSNVKIFFIDKNLKLYNEYFYKGGIIEYLKLLNNNKKIINKNIFKIHKIKKNIEIELVLQWNNSFKNNILCFTNNIFQKEGGVHLSGLKKAITRSINNYLIKILNYKKINIIGDDTREGLTAIISIKMSNPKFSSQTKDKLISSEIKQIIESIIFKKLNKFLLNNSDTKLIINKIINSAKIRINIKKEKELLRKKKYIDNISLNGKLSDCQVKNPDLSELYLVEGDSAGGSAKQARNRHYQAILPLKGKILNVEKVNFIKMMSSKEILNIIASLKCILIDKKFDISNLKYHKIIIMTDADIDGLHIRSLLLTFFYKYLPDIIDKGYIYIAQPPLYKIKFLNKNKYLLNEQEFKYYIINLFINNYYLYIKNINNNFIKCINKNVLKKIILQYYKIKKIINIFKYKYTKIFLKNIIFYSKKIDFNSYENLLIWINKINKNLNLKYNFFYKYKLVINRDDYYKGVYLFINKFNIFEKKIFIKKDFFNSKKFKILTSLKLYFNNIFNSNNKIYLINKNNINKKTYINNFDNIIKFIKKNIINKLFIQRYKGLGEMNPLQLWKTTMNPKTRKIIKIYLKDIDKINNSIYNLMGNNVKFRKDFISKNNYLNDNLDI